MRDSIKDNRADFQPPFSKRSAAWRKCRLYVQALSKVDPSDIGKIAQLREKALADASHESEQDRYVLRVALCFLSDLRLHGWSFRCGPGRIQLVASIPNDKEAVREAHLRGRQIQLSTSSVREFVRSMERRRLGPTGWASIFSLMRDGREFAQSLREARSMSQRPDATSALCDVIDPYIQFVDDSSVCEHTGLRLMDIWRYFRHTWTNEYTTVPGRTFHLLIRDRAADHHPVIGIAALASPVIQLSSRDRWIGWTSNEFVEYLRVNASASWAKWVATTLDDLVDEIFVDDLVSEKVITRAMIARPTLEAIKRLCEFAERERDLHRRFPDRHIHKNPKTPLTRAEWQKRTNTHLFRWKRGVALSELLDARRSLLEVRYRGESKTSLLSALDDATARRAIDIIRRFTKARFVGNDVLDITTCGAIAPYNEVLCGKLVAMLLTSPEVCAEYSRRYGKVASIIASSMAGRAVHRRPQLAVLTTTSLYGGGLSQYSRISVPSSACGGDGQDRVRFEQLDVTEGQGSFHFSESTLEEIEVLQAREVSRPRVNSIFGEGVNPKLRKVRTALEMAGFPSDFALTHGCPRAMYGAILASNSREILLGKDRRLKYILGPDSGAAATTGIARYWMQRWLVPRLMRDDVLARISGETLVSPVVHRARVALPQLHEEEPLFAGISE